jgi:DNA-binding MarR family transcriptional regulator
MAKSDSARSQPEFVDYHERIPYLIGAISNVLSADASRAYRERFGVGLTETRLMWVMSHEPNLTVQRASQIMGIDKAATSRALARLVRRGLATVTVDPEDSRRRTIIFSASGLKLRDRIMSVSFERERLIDAIFSDAELAVIRLLLSKLLKGARELSTAEAQRAQVARTPASGITARPENTPTA